MSIYGLKDVIWSYIARGVRPKVLVSFGKPFGPYKLPADKKEKGEALIKIGDEVMCRIAALLPEDSHGEFKGNPKIEEFRIQNNMTS
jgi:1-acyl-sn-glycerol-3-phosphate acyltransferase